MIFMKPKSKRFRCVVHQDTFALIPRQYFAEIIEESDREDLSGELLLFRCTTSHVFETSFVPVAPLKLGWYNRKRTFDDTLREQDILEVTYYLDVDIFSLKASPRIAYISPPSKNNLIEFKREFLYLASGGQILMLGKIEKTSLIQQVAAQNMRSPFNRDDFTVGEWDWFLEVIPHYKLPEDIAKDSQVVRAVEEHEVFRSN